MSDITGLNTFLETWSSCGSVPDAKAKLDDATSLLSSLHDSIATGIMDGFHESVDTYNKLTSKVLDDLETRILEAETTHDALQAKVQDHLLALLEPLYVAVNTMIAKVAPYGYQPVGSLNYLPQVPFFQEVPNAETTTTPNMVGEPVSPTTTNETTGTTGNKSVPEQTNSQTSNNKKTEGEQSLTITSLLEASGQPVDIPITPTNPLWLIGSQADSKAENLKAILSPVRPIVSGVEVYGPFTQKEQAMVFVENINNYLSKRIQQTPITREGGTANCPFIISVNCSSCDNLSGIAGNSPRPSEANRNAEQSLVNALEDLSTSDEYLEWIETDSGLKSLTQTLVNTGYDPEQWLNPDPAILADRFWIDARDKAFTEDNTNG